MAFDPKPRTRPAGAAAPLLPLLLVLAGACASTENGQMTDPFHRAVRTARFEQALALARKEVDANPESAAAQERLRDAEVLVALEKGRRLNFEGETQAALDAFLEAQAIDPENPAVQVWVAKTRHQLAVQWLDVADALSSDADLDRAEQAYRRVLLYDPGDEDAKEGLERTQRRRDWRSDRSQSYFFDGLDKYRQSRLESADRDFGVATEYDGSNEGAERRREDVQSQLAQQNLFTARQLEADGLFSASLSEYRSVLVDQPDQPEAKAAVERLDREVRAARFLAQAGMDVRRKEFDKAEEHLGQARALTTAQMDAVTRLEADLETARWEELYDRAHGLYEDQRYREAVAVLDELLSKTEVFKDAVELRDALKSTIAHADALYAQAQASDDDKEKLDLLRQIAVVWEEYPNLRSEIAALEKRLGPEAG